MSVSSQDVLHIARLARIELTADECARFERELSSILDFFETLQSADATAAVPLAGGTGLERVLRDDTARPGAPRSVSSQKLIAAAPANRDGYVRVLAVFDRP